MKSQQKVDKMQKMLGELNDDENKNDFLIENKQLQKNDSILDYYVNLKSDKEIDDINIDEEYIPRTLEEIYINENQNTNKNNNKFDEDNTLNNELF